MGIITGGTVIDGAGRRIRSFPLGSPALGTTAAVHAAIADTGSEQVVTTAITNPDAPRNITATAGGTAADIAAIQVTVAGTDVDGHAITESLPAFTVDTPGTVTGAKAFATVTSITVPAHDGTGATTAVGVGSKLAIPVRLPRNTVVAAFLDGVRESTMPTVTVDAANLEANTVTLASALDGSAVIVDAYEP